MQVREVGSISFGISDFFVWSSPRNSWFDKGCNTKKARGAGRVDDCMSWGHRVQQRGLLCKTMSHEYSASHDARVRPQPTKSHESVAGSQA